ncbi:hypothetical protein RJT34_03912 [Clitoria ternatea]|uniref:DYW domain-containing protein n=1 Tax=Clitoria ternatea TaxID=43366 RepID=A0AAN9KNU2_CLITE
MWNKDVQQLCPLLSLTTTKRNGKIYVMRGNGCIFDMFRNMPYKNDVSWNIAVWWRCRKRTRARASRLVVMVKSLLDIEMIVRDIHRFHYFKHGSSSCGDYW